MAKTVKIKFQNGINKDIACKAIINELTGDYVFEESDTPDFILFGPYGNDIPPPGNYIRIGYFCENIRPDMAICEWAFGIPYENEVNDYRYKRIQWHDVDPRSLIKAEDYNAEKISGEKQNFCAFIYGHSVPYREEFFKQLSRYKKVDAPGKSMNNMPNTFDSTYKGNVWERKRQFLNTYKFTVSFENYVYPGYQTEKLYDAMLANTIPIYCGDIFVNKVFNTESFVNLPDYIQLNNSAAIDWLERHVQQDFKDIRPAYYNGPYHKLRRKLKTIGRDIKMNTRFKGFDFEPVIEKIIELDNNHDKYIQMLKQPWFNNNTIPENTSLKSRWIEIFKK